ncbi:MAG: hypothetical protein ABSH20_08395 [Tepidisphaeraceae bacterium]|jgi:hypothetical protein
MNEDLYFLPLIESALAAPDSRSALRSAFAQIKQLGGQAAYAAGYRQFLRFMAASVEHAQQVDARLAAEIEQMIGQLMLELACGDFHGDEQERRCALEMIRSVDQWRQEFEAIGERVRPLPAADPGPTLILERDDHSVVSPAGWNGRAISGIEPGGYCLKLDTGMVLWRGTLGRRHLVWSAAYPGKPMKLAASTGQAAPTPTAEELLADGSARMRVHPGLENGIVEVQIIAGNQ